MSKQAPGNRWKLAQQDELGKWHESASGINSEYAAAARNLSNVAHDWMSSVKEISTSSHLLQVGPAVVGEINYFNDPSCRVAIDPLAYYYLKDYPDFWKNIHYLPACGEEIPFPSHYFDLVLSVNLLDHVRDPFQVMREMRRVLDAQGLLFFVQHVYQPLGFYVRTASEKIYKFAPLPWLVDSKHPFTFTEDNLKHLLDETGFQILRWKGPDWQSARLSHRKSSKLIVKTLRGYGLLTSTACYGLLTPA